MKKIIYLSIHFFFILIQNSYTQQKLLFNPMTGDNTNVVLNSDYGPRFSSGKKNHLGLDLKAKENDPVYFRWLGYVN